MFTVKKGSILYAFQNQCQLILYNYFTKYSMYGFKELWFSLKINRFAILSQGPHLWNKILENNTKDCTSYFLIQKTIKIRLMDLQNAV